MYFYWWVIWLSPWSGILVYIYDIGSVVGVYTPVGVVTEWLWSVHSKLECTLRQGKGYLYHWGETVTIIAVTIIEDGGRRRRWVRAGPILTLVRNTVLSYLHTMEAYWCHGVQKIGLS